MKLFSFWPRKKKGSCLYSASAALKPLQQPTRTHAREQLRRTVRALIEAQSRHREFLKRLRKSNDLATSKESQNALVEYIKEVRQFVDGLEICLILLVSDYHKVDGRKTFRPFLERTLKELQKVI